VGSSQEDESSLHDAPKTKHVDEEKRPKTLTRLFFGGKILSLRTTTHAKILFRIHTGIRLYRQDPGKNGQTSKPTGIDSDNNTTRTLTLINHNTRLRPRTEMNSQTQPARVPKTTTNDDA
jgi:hypothetical protein